MKEAIVERELLVSNPEGDKFETKIQFSKPHKTERKGWLCDLVMDGIDKPRYAAGADSLQAILLTISLAESILINRSEQGWRFFYPDSEEQMQPDEFILWPETVKMHKK